MKRNNFSERGQILILLVVGLVGLFGFAALAIDGGMVWSDRRYDQNAADAAALAGAWSITNYFSANGVTDTNFTCPPGATVADAIDNQAIPKAQENGLTINNDQATAPNPPSDKNGAWVTCGSDYVDVHVMITKTVQTSLIHLVYSGPVVNTVEAVARTKPMQNLFQGASLVSTSLACNKPSTGNFGQGSGGIFIGGIGGPNQVILHDGSIFTDSCLETSGGVYVRADNGTIEYVDTTRLQNNADVVPTPSKANEPLDFYPLNLDPCLGSQTQPSTVAPLLPGTYSPNGNKPAINVKNGETWVMEPGLYCLDGDLNVKGTLSVDVGASGKEGVTIYMRSGNVLLDAGSTIDLRAPMFTTDADWLASTSHANHAYNRLLIYAAPSLNFGSNPQINLGGNPTSVFKGMIYAPTSYIDFGGNTTATGYEISIIGYAVTVHGSGVLDFYNSNQFKVEVPASMKLYR